MPQFQPFQKLPTELRVLIWRTFLDISMPPFHPYRVRPYMGRTKVFTALGHVSYKSTIKLIPMPELSRVSKPLRDMMRICREARYEFLRVFPDSLEFNSGGIFRFSAAKDIIYLDIIDGRVITEIVVSHREQPENLPSFTETIRHVGFDIMAVVPRWSAQSRHDLSPRLDFILSFTRLQSLCMIGFDDLIEEEVLYTRGYEHYKSWRKLDGVAYDKPTSVGNVTNPGRHVCIYCALSKCDDLQQRLEGKRRAQGDPDLTCVERQRLKALDFYGIVPVKDELQEQEDRRIEEFEGIGVKPREITSDITS